MPLSTLGFVKGVPFVKARYTKGVNFLSKIVFKMVGGWTSVRGPPLIYPEYLVWVNSRTQSTF